MKDIGNFVWNHGGKQITAGAIVIGGIVGGTYIAVETIGLGSKAGYGIAIGSLMMATEILDNDDNSNN